MDKGSRGCRPVGMECTCVRDKALLELHSASRRLNPDSKGVHITEVTGNSLGSPLFVCLAQNRRVSRVNLLGTLAVTGFPSQLRRIYSDTNIAAFWNFRASLSPPHNAP
jgi:hypothetical protein